MGGAAGGAVGDAEGSQECLPCRMTFECLCASIVSFQGAYLGVPGLIHDAENVGPSDQGDRDKARSEAVPPRLCWRPLAIL
jgi:hypothetical protein